VYRIKKSAYPSGFFESDPMLDRYAFADCCEVSPCVKLVTSCEGVDCPIECTLDCLELEETYVGYYVDEYYYIAVVTLKDNVGNTQKYYAIIYIGLGEDCKIEVLEGCCTDDGILWVDPHGKDSNLIGACKGDSVTCNQPLP